MTGWVWVFYVSVQNSKNIPGRQFVFNHKKDIVTYTDSGTVTFFCSKFLINILNREAGLQLRLSDTQYKCLLHSQRSLKIIFHKVSCVLLKMMKKTLLRI